MQIWFALSLSGIIHPHELRVSPKKLQYNFFQEVKSWRLSRNYIRKEATLMLSWETTGGCSKTSFKNYAVGHRISIKPKASQEKKLTFIQEFSEPV